MMECNVDWQCQTETLADWFEGWFSHKKVICSNNQKINPNLSKPFQSGGTATIATNATASHALTSGVDPRGLGRWSWIRLTGKNSLTTRVIMAYCPIKNPNPSRCYAQQIQGLLLQDIQSCPRRQFWVDLKQVIKDGQVQGDQLIVMGDWKSRMKDADAFFSDLGMEETIRKQHTSAPPVTCNRSHSEPIDGIYTSSTIVRFHGSCLAFGKLGRDHRGLLLDIPDEYIFGFTLQDLVPPSAHRLKMDNPAVVEKYNCTLWQIFEETRLDKEIEALHEQSTYPMKSHVLKHFERIDAKIQAAQLCAERKCAHIYAGYVEWSPQVQKAYKLVDFWSMAVDTFQGKTINRPQYKNYVGIIG